MERVNPMSDNLSVAQAFMTFARSQLLEDFFPKIRNARSC